MGAKIDIRRRAVMQEERGRTYLSSLYLGSWEWVSESIKKLTGTWAEWTCMMMVVMVLEQGVVVENVILSQSRLVVRDVINRLGV